ncbi:hypothetical protein [Delftia tsuruhatensis]|uniref:hypothetical protein n=1 Tax=Delftia tsuruhatensis TaxID=180282 RepID=UPI000AA1B07B|nr:hypothetical protein [Delftia tsuruhatensis]
MKIIKDDDENGPQEIEMFPRWAKVSAFLFALFAVCFFIYKQPSRNPVEDKKPVASYWYKEGDEVEFIPGRWGCEYRQRFDDIYILHVLGKKIAVDDDLSRAWPLCITSSRVERGQTFTVLEINGEYARISTATLEQSLKSRDAGYEKFSYWTRAEWLRK